MARPLRIDFPGAWHHVSSRGNERREVFRTDGDRRQWLTLLAQVPERFGAAIHGYPERCCARQPASTVAPDTSCAAILVR
ncbi:MAG: hypothetical protein ACR2OZ_11255 [Verrucomicrobiales bacterium]